LHSVLLHKDYGEVVTASREPLANAWFQFWTLHKFTQNKIIFYYSICSSNWKSGYTRIKQDIHCTYNVKSWRVLIIIFVVIISETFLTLRSVQRDIVIYRVSQE
jgi:hypothetical protein